MTTDIYIIPKLVIGGLLILFFLWILRRLWRQSAYLSRGRSRWKRFIQITIHHTLRFFLRFIGGFHYRIKVRGKKNLPRRQGGLLVCNHVSYLDAVILSAVSPRPIRFLAFSDFFKVPVLGFILRVFGCIPVSELRAKDALRKAAEVIKSGEIVCIFPEGKLTTTGNLLELKPGYQIIARRAEVSVIPVQIEGLYGSSMSYVNDKCFRFEPSHLFKRRHIVISISEPLPSENAGPETLKNTLEKSAAAAVADSTAHPRQTPPANTSIPATDS
ncbi:MAG: 1-acyl-sn-glycerol-3-phosphate acyltransferase [Chthoniobacterales bacterium]